MDGEEEVFVKAGEVQSFFTEEFWEAYEFYATTEILGAPPFSGGWTTWPAIAMQTLLILKTEENRWNTEELKNQQKDSASHGYNDRTIAARNRSGGKGSA
jgi:hypothetical protein